MPEDIIRYSKESASQHNLPPELLVAAAIGYSQMFYTIDYTFLRGLQVAERRGSIPEGTTELFKKLSFIEKFRINGQKADFIGGVVIDGKTSMGINQLHPAWVREYNTWERFGIDARELSDR